MRKLIDKPYRIFRILFPKPKLKLTASEVFMNTLKFYFENIELNNDLFEVKDSETNLSLFLRKYPHSDLDVYSHVFKQNEYKIVYDLYSLNFDQNKYGRCVFVDCGSNVGFTSLFFSHLIKDIKIFAIEPDSQNFKLLDLNFSINKLESKNFNLGIAGEDNVCFKIEKNFRDGRDHAFVTVNDIEGDVESITLNRLMKENNLDYISILKIDIEGAERFLFAENVNLNYLEKTYLIAIEIHDEFEIRSQIYRKLKEIGFVIFNNGELTIGINKWMLNK